MIFQASDIHHTNEQRKLNMEPLMSRMGLFVMCCGKQHCARVALKYAITVQSQGAQPAASSPFPKLTRSSLSSSFIQMATLKIAIN